MTFQRPSGAYTGAEGLTNRTKFQEEAAQEPKVAISSTKMDGEFNYVVDALNSINTAKGSTESIDARLSHILNADGTLKSSITASVDDWVTHGASNLQRVDGTSVQMDGNQTGLYPTGRRVRLMVGGNSLYADVASSVFITYTTLTLTNIVNASGNTDTLATHPESIAYAPTLPGIVGNARRVFDALQLGTSYRLVEEGANCAVQHNAGTVSQPNWQTVSTFTENGFAFADESIALDKLMRTGEAGQFLTSNGSSGAPSFQTFYTVPTGAVQPFAGSILPDGWLACDGSYVSRTTYNGLFNMIGTTYGAGDGSTTFTLPDLRGRTVFGKDNGADRVTAASALGSAGGAASHTENTGEHVLTEAQMPTHSHTLDYMATGLAGNSGGSGYFSASGYTVTTEEVGGSEPHSHTLDINLMNPFLTLQWMIRT